MTNEEPLNPYYMYDNATEEYLRDNLKRKMFEYSSYMKWAERAEEEVRYIQDRLREKKK